MPPKKQMRSTGAQTRAADLCDPSVDYAHAIEAVIEAWTALNSWIESPNPSMDGDALRRVDRALLADMRAAVDALHDFDPALAVAPEARIAEAVADATLDMAEETARWIEDYAQNVEAAPGLSDETAATLLDAGNRVADRVRELAARWDNR